MVKMTKVGTASIRSSHLRCSVRRGVPRNFAKFTGKYLCQSLFFNKVAGLRQHLFYRAPPVAAFEVCNRMRNP